MKLGIFVTGIDVPRETIRDWLGGNDVPSIIAKKHRNGGNAKANILAKSTFLSSCCRIEDFAPADGHGYVPTITHGLVRIYVHNPNFETRCKILNRIIPFQLSQNVATYTEPLYINILSAPVG